MPTIQNASDQLLEAARQLPPPELERLLNRLQGLRRQPAAPSLLPRETVLLRRINQALPAAAQQRYAALHRKHRRASLTLAEQRELLALSKEREQFEVERLQHLAELARLRKLGLPELMRQLGLTPPEPEYD